MEDESESEDKYLGGASLAGLFSFLVVFLVRFGLGGAAPSFVLCFEPGWACSAGGAPDASSCFFAADLVVVVILKCVVSTGRLMILKISILGGQTHD